MSLHFLRFAGLHKFNKILYFEILIWIHKNEDNGKRYNVVASRMLTLLLQIE